MRALFILMLVSLSASEVVRARVDFPGGRWKRTTPDGPSTFVIPLSLDESGFYHSNVRMGSDNQRFNFTVSGSTGYTIVAGQVCNACVHQNPLYSPSNSSSFQSLGAVLDISVDGVNQVFGNLAKENCGLQQANSSWWQYNNQTILMANSVNDGTRDIFTPQISGVLGLSPTAQTRTPADTVLGAWLLRHPQAQSVSVGFALKRPDVSNATTNTGNSTNGTSLTSSAGEMHMLAPDPDSYFGALVSAPTTSYESTGAPIYGTGGGQQMQAAGWATTLEHWTFLNAAGEEVAGGKGAVAAVDPWYSGIVMPKSESESIFARIPGSQLVSASDASQQTWTIPCNTRLNLTISIAGIDFDIDPRDLIVEGDTSAGSARKRQDAVCPCSVQGWADPTVPGYMLGGAFMRNAYVVYNNVQSNSSQQNSIGFGRRFPFNPPTTAQAKRARTTGIIIGSIAAVLVATGGAALGWLWWRNRQRAHRAPSEDFMDKSPSGFASGGFKTGGGMLGKTSITIAPGVIFSTSTGRRGSDPESYPLMQTPTTSSPPREGQPLKSFEQQQRQGPVVHVEDADQPQELHTPAHEAYLARLARHTQVQWAGSGAAGGYARINEQDGDGGAHAYGPHAQVYRDQEHEYDAQGRYDTDYSPPRSADDWEQPYHQPAPSSGGRVPMVVEPIAKPEEAAQKEETRG